jgi:hypothetical protein
MRNKNGTLDSRLVRDYGIRHRIEWGNQLTAKRIAPQNETVMMYENDAFTRRLNRPNML